MTTIQLMGANHGGGWFYMLGGFGREAGQVTDVRLVGAIGGQTTLDSGFEKRKRKVSDVRMVAGTNGEMGAKRMGLEVSDVRLVALPTYTTQTESGFGRRKGKEGAAVSDVRLTAPSNGDQHRSKAVGGKVSDVRLVVDANAAKNQVESGVGTMASDHYAVQAPSLLISYAYWPQFAKHREKYVFRDFVLDSGAFTAEKSGKPVDLAEFTRFALERQDTDPQCSEIFALDVIGDWRASLVNTEKMWKAGVRAIPTYHYGEPEHVLLELARTYPKIALGGAVGLHAKVKMRWVQQCFARVWPKRIHGFGMMGQELLNAVPFHSVDASNWEIAPAGFGTYKSMGRPHRAPRAKHVNLRAEVEWYLRLERELKQRWSREMAKLATLPTERAHPKQTPTRRKAPAR